MPAAADAPDQARARFLRRIAQAGIGAALGLAVSVNMPGARPGCVIVTELAVGFDVLLEGFVVLDLAGGMRASPSVAPSRVNLKRSRYM